jgi:polo-like kinase 1
MLLERFVVQLNEEVAKLPEPRPAFFKSEGFVYMKQWLKTRHAIMFGLSNKIFQVNFFDGSQILLNTEYKTVLFCSKRGEKSCVPLVSALHTTDP